MEEEQHPTRHTAAGIGSGNQLEIDVQTPVAKSQSSLAGPNLVLPP